MDLYYLLEKRQSFLNNYSKIGEKIFLAILGLYIFSEFLTGTTFMYVVNENFVYRMILVASILAILKIIFFNEFSNWQECLLVTVIGMFIWACSMNANTYIMIYYYIMIVAAKNIDFKKILQVFLVVVTVSLIITFLSAKLGIIAGLINLRDNSSDIRYALGTIYPTDLAARIFYLELVYVLIKKFKLKISEYVILLTITTWAYIITDTRLDVLLMILLILCCVFREKIFKFIEYVGNKTISLVLLGSIAAIILMTYFYTAHSFFLRIVNKVLSGRLFYSNEAFIKYNVTFFGQWIPQQGNGGIHTGTFHYFYIDSSFIRILMMQGFFCFILMVGILIYMSNRFIRNKWFSLEIILIFVILSSIIDQHLLELSFNCFLLSLFANNEFLTKKCKK